MVDKQRTLPELLAPAGDMERLKMAVLYGADAVKEGVIDRVGGLSDALEELYRQIGKQ